MNDVRVAVAQRTRSRLDQKTGSDENVAEISTLTTGNQLVGGNHPGPCRTASYLTGPQATTRITTPFGQGDNGFAASGAYDAEPELLSASVETLLELGDAHHHQETRWAKKILRDDGDSDNRANLAGCGDQPQVPPLDSHPGGRLGLPGVSGKMGMTVLLDSGPGMTGLFESINNQLGRRWAPTNDTIRRSGRIYTIICER